MLATRLIITKHWECWHNPGVSSKHVWWIRILAQQPVLSLVFLDDSSPRCDWARDQNCAWMPCNCVFGVFGYNVVDNVWSYRCTVGSGLPNGVAISQLPFHACWSFFLLIRVISSYGPPVHLQKLRGFVRSKACT